MTKRTPLTYLITDRHQLSHPDDLTAVAGWLTKAMDAGVDMVQLRERDLSTRSQFELAAAVAETARANGVRLLINDRADLAACLGLGVHLTTRSMSAATIRQTFGREMFMGVSTHTLAEAREAERGGADFIVFGPVFETASKQAFGAPVGLEALQAVTTALKIPVLALGGVNLSNAAATLACGAAGIAAISLFTKADDLASLMRRLKSYESLPCAAAKNDINPES